MLASTFFLLGVSLLGQTDASHIPSHHQYFKRAQCNADNLYRCFIDERYSSSASNYCLGLTPTTVTIATTAITSTSTVTVLATVDGTAGAVTATTTVYTTTCPESIVIVTRTGVPQTVQKRDGGAGSPKCMTSGTTYPASRITSACSCIDVPAETFTAAHQTMTATVTKTVTSEVTRGGATQWTTVEGAFTKGVRTVTVNPPSSTNLLVNGDFGTANYDSWELSPQQGWTISMEAMEAVPDMPPWAIYIRSDSSASTANFKNTQTVDLVAGAQYRIGFTTPTKYDDWSTWGEITLNNPKKGTNIVLKTFAYSTFAEAPLYRVEAVWTVTDNLAGFNEFSFRCLVGGGKTFNAKFYNFFIEKA